MKKILILILSLFGFSASVNASELPFDNHGMIVRISEIEIYPKYFNEYINFARKVAEDSVAKEKGVISIYPMVVIKDNNQSLFTFIDKCSSWL